MKKIVKPSNISDKAESTLLEDVLNKDVNVVVPGGSLVCLNYKKSWQPCIYGEYIDDKGIKRNFLASYDESNSEYLEFFFAEKMKIKKNNKLKILWTAQMYVNDGEGIWFSDVTWEFDVMMWNSLIYTAIWRSTEKLWANKKAKNDICSASSMLQRDCCSTIASMFAEQSPKNTIDIFSQENIITQLNTEGTKFISHLHNGPRSSPIKPSRHWADMLPWMVEWFQKFLEKKWMWWGGISKIRFIKTTYGDLTYTITNDEDKDRQKNAHVVGQFTDDNGQVYYFYAKEIKPSKPVSRSENKIASSIITNNSHERVQTCLKIKKDKKFSLPCYNQMKNNSAANIQKMRKNDGYVRATVMDMVNITYMFKAMAGWWVTKYYNLQINKDVFSPEQLFDWSCVLESEILGESCKLEDDLWLTTCNFKIIHKGKEELLHGTVKLYTTTALK